jgi:two-component system sensor histidine kinase/response regulator
MSIRVKSILLVLLAATLLAALATILIIVIVLRRFNELERTLAEHELDSVTQTVTAMLKSQRTVALQWSNWTDAYNYVQQPDQNFAAKNLVPSAVVDSHVTTIAYLDFNGRLLGWVSSRAADMPPYPNNLFVLAPELLPEIKAGREQVGLIASDGLIYALTLLPVFDSDGKGEPRGVCMLLRELDRSALNEFTESALPPVALTIATSNQPPRSIDVVDDERLRGRIQLIGLDGRVAAQATMELPRPVDLLARRTMRELVVCGILALLGFTGFLMWLLERTVLRRIVRLGREISAQEKESSARITVDGSDELGYLAGVVDRTVARQRETAHRAEASQQRYRMLFQRSADPILVVDGDTILDANRAAARLFGAPSRRVLMETPFSKLVDGSTHRPSNGQEASSATRAALPPRTGKTSSDKLNEWTMFALDGRAIEAEVREAVLEIDGREAVQVLIRDVTERRKAEAERRLLAGLIEATTDCVVVGDAQGNTAFLNSAARRMLAIPEQEILGKIPVETFFSTASREIQRNTAQPLAHNHGVWRGETELVSRDGRNVPVSQVLIAVLDDLGHVTHLGSLLRDISVERERESQLVIARHTAEDAVRAKSSFLAIMSHELRTPLNGVIGMTSLLQESDLPQEHAELVDTVKMCADNLLVLINDILDLSKIEAGGLELENISFDVRELVESAVTIVAEQAMGKGLEIGCLVDSGVPAHVSGDPTRLRQIIVNLLGNAVKFTERGEVLLSVHHHAPPEGASAGSVRLSFAVKDTGIGIPAEVVPRLFRPFVQGDDSTTRKHGGTGLGLAISQRLVSCMGGDIAVISSLGQGSTFTFNVVLPVVPGETCEIHPDLAKSTVLVADPSPTSRQIASTMLSAWGCRTLEVPSIHQAVDAIRSGRIVAVLTAQYLSDGDARDLVQAIRAERAGERVGIALLAPIFQRHKERLLVTTGATALVVKPLRNANLLTTMNQLLTGAPPVTINAPTVKRKGLAGKRVLVVEDNATNRMLALRILEVLGLRSSAVSCGEEALDTLAVETYDLVLMDCQMPKLDGIEATKLFREREARETALMRRMDAGHLNRRACIVAVTAHAMAGDRERCLGVGMDDYLAKPYTIDDLRKMLEKWIG